MPINQVIIIWANHCCFLATWLKLSTIIPSTSSFTLNVSSVETKSGSCKALNMDNFVVPPPKPERTANKLWAASERKDLRSNLHGKAPYTDNGNSDSKRCLIDNTRWLCPCQDYAKFQISCSVSLMVNRFGKHSPAQKTSQAKLTTGWPDDSIPGQSDFKVDSSVGRAPDCCAGGRRFKPRPDQHSALQLAEENVLTCKWLDVQVFSDKDYKP